MVDLDAIRAAHQRIKGHVLDTPFVHSRTLSAIVGSEVHLKFENLQFTSSFKERGALNRLETLTPAQRQAGVLAVSAGNHAQGVAYHAQRLDIPATIVMPRFTPTIKIENTRRFGAEVILEGESFDQARVRGIELAEARGLTLIHPYDDEAVIAGQGTIGLEMLVAQPSLDMLVVSVGGGGLIAGVATVAKALAPWIEIIGIQTERFPAMFARFKGLNLTSASSTIAEGIAVQSPGALTSAVIQERVDDMMLVDESDLEHAIVLFLEIEKTVVEGAGAAGLAALLRARLDGDTRFLGKKIGLILSGGNIDPLTLADIIERGMVRAGRLARIRVDLRDLPGALARITAILAEVNANIEEVHHQRAFTALPVQSVEVDFVLQTRGPEHIELVIERINAAGFHAARI
ncbi:MAG: threonine ammonia-lyase [Burkholderiaceae bacterium]